MKKITITCDACEKDITDTGKYHLKLSSELHLLDSNQVRTAIMRRPLIEKVHHFCNFKCLRERFSR